MPDNATQSVAFAVVQTGGTTSAADIVSFTDESGQRRPAVLGVFADESKAIRMRKRIASRYGKIARFEDPKFGLLIPIIGVVKVHLEAKLNRGPRKAKVETNGKPAERTVEQPVHAPAKGKPVADGKR